MIRKSFRNLFITVFALLLSFSLLLKSSADELLRDGENSGITKNSILVHDTVQKISVRKTEDVKKEYDQKLSEYMAFIKLKGTGKILSWLWLFIITVFLIPLIYFTQSIGAFFKWTGICFGISGLFSFFIAAAVYFIIGNTINHDAGSDMILLNSIISVLIPKIATNITIKALAQLLVSAAAFSAATMLGEELFFVNGQ